nr:LysE family translocator [Corynebacterium timonense]
MAPGDLAAIVGLNLVGAAAPGPDIVLLTRTATRSRKHAWATLAGTQTGVLMWVSLTVVGAAAVLTAFPRALNVVQMVGGAFLIFMGISNALQGWRERNDPPKGLEEAAGKLGSLPGSYLRGLSTNLANPKIVLALSAMIAPLLPPNPSTLSAVVVIASLWLSSMALMAVVAQVVSTEKVRRKLLAAGPRIDMGAGAFFLVVGIVFAARGAGGMA